MTSHPMRIAYLTSLYARASDSFIREEVGQLRSLGHLVRTFSIRKPADNEAVSDDIRREQLQTKYILTRENYFGLAAATLRTLIRTPLGFGRALGLAVQCSTPGIKGRVWSIAYLVEACFLAERLRAERIEHLHNHIAEGSAIVAMLAASLTKIQYSLTIHGPGEFDRPASLRFDIKVRRAKFVAVVSEYGRSQLSRWIRVEDWPKVQVVRCGVNERFVARTSAEVVIERQFVFVGRLVAEKGLLTLIEAVRVLAEEGLSFRLIVIGDGEMRGAVEDRITRYALHDHIRLRGWKSSEEVRTEILRSRAFVLPSFAENLPVAIMEALALARPVISTYVGGIPELVREADCGWLVPPSSVPALASAMREALTLAPEQLERMGRTGTAAVARRHNARIEAGKLSRLFSERRLAPNSSAPIWDGHILVDGSPSRLG